MLPNFLVIGAARSGTTWIAKNLSLHPEIFIPARKELHFFDAQYERGIEFYRECFRGAESKPAVGEATPAYLHVEAAAERIKQHLPDVKLIACLRDPVDRLYSRYWNARGRFAHNRHLTFEEKLKEKPEFISEGFYCEHLARFLRLWPRERVLLLLYDDLVADPQRFLQTIYRFLEVDEHFVSDLAEQKINAAAAQKLTVKSPAAYWLGKLLRRAGQHSLAHKLETSNAGALPALPSSTRKWLIETYYSDKNQQLARLLGRDLSHWNSA